MKFKDDDAAIAYVRANLQVPKPIIAGRKEARELFALIEGDGFIEELIHRIEHLESTAKKRTRAKYSRNIVDFYERLLQPITNVFSAAGGSKKYDIDSKDKMMAFLGKIGNLRDNKSIQKYVENTWMPLYHSDPNGVIFMEYTTEKKHGVNDVYPTYKSIYSIRAYIPRGQLVDAILFEPKKKVVRINEVPSSRIIWRLVDDQWDRFIIQDGDHFVVDENLSFEHPFGQVPAIINSDIVKIGATEFKISPIHKVKELTKEYARDQSVKTLYKFLQGFPIHWRYVTQCRTCQGTGKKGDKNCSDCDAKGFYMKKDVTDIVTLTAPKTTNDVKIAPDIAGYISPDLKTWEQYNTELQLLETLANDTHWGTHKEKGGNETATGRFIDVQPVMNRLNKYADTAEWVEMKLSEWIFRYLNAGTKKDVVSINYGRRYIIEGPDVILEKYQTAKEKGANNVILDRLYNEYLTAKYGNDPQWLRFELLKSDVEPYLHIGLEKVNEIFGREAAEKKALFTDWWKTLDDKAKDKSAEQLKKDYTAWYKLNKTVIIVVEETPPQD